MIDTHIHLDDARFDDERQSIIADFAKDGIDLAINASCDQKTMDAGIALSRLYDRVFCTLGMHPHDASKYDEAFEQSMIEYATEPKAVAVGEIGLDYYYDLSNRQIQREVFARQIEVAHRLQLPLMLHIRDAFGDMTDILQAQRQYIDNGLLLHCYSGSGETAKQLLTKYDAYFAFGGALTFKKNRKCEVLEQIPLTRILTETDAPYLAPEPYRGKLNRPQYISYILPVIAAAYNTDCKSVEEQIYLNALTFFQKIALFYQK